MEGRRTDKRKGKVNEYLDDILTQEEQDVYNGAQIVNKLREDVVADEPKASYNSIRLQLRISAKVKLYGEVTGKLYVWDRSGAIVEVDEQDATGLLAKKLGDKACCGGNPDNLKLFVKIDNSEV